MVKIAIAGASGDLAREVIDKLAESNKHEVLALIRKDPLQFPSISGVKWVQTSYEDEAELVNLFEGVETVLCFFAVLNDPGNVVQKRIIDASIKAGVKRYAPAEWATGTKLESRIDIMPWYAGKLEVSHYLEALNKDKKVLEYTRFQIGLYMNYLGHPHKVSKYLTTMPTNIDFENGRALLAEGSLDDQLTFTTAHDVAAVVARAVEYEESVRGKPFTIEWEKMEDLEAKELKSENYIRLPFPGIPEDQLEAFSKLATVSVLLGDTTAYGM
uniref:NmrA-like domain-containing protein n=1 Tax=Bionectria ochroleuca TaxID=29856 RepID=A0A8H7N1T1_BIOOC